MIDKKYPRIEFNDKVLNYNLLSTLFILLFVIVFFNNSPETDFEIFLYELLIKERGIYSQIYPFPSQIISNLIMWLTPISALSLTIKFNYLSEKEIINLGGVIERNGLKKFFMKVAWLFFILAVIFICSFPIYIDYAPLNEVEIRTTFFRDSFVMVIFLPYLFYMCSMSVMSIFFTIIFHPINFFKYQYKLPYIYDRKDKIRLLMKNKRKSEK
ncbi:hypothetical protein BKK54_03040 [Rodentibacter genomosp. 1]|uniref:Uncharacterized protein n=1 Tax=Rodentibacter genomosp. 1 TaxID=1908264 RepID=A0A1V3J8I3_9PAST|nr:hypothetical protein [Rodentibacter genomosp. 1]OOF51595.1 hypothetical protein BKK54_03040 [Rodentibacter genomosp. 1]